MNNELYHHGIKGQKWGVRRFQNKDGKLTDAGKKRYAEYNNDYKEYKTLNRHVSAAQRHLKEEGVMLDRVRDTYQRYGNRYRREMSRGSGLFGLRAAEKADRVARAQSAMDNAGKDLEAAANAYGFASNIARKDRKALGNHVNKMLDKYGKGSVPEIEYETVKIGQNKLQKILQGAPVSTVFGRRRDTDVYVKTGKTVADMPIVGNFYTANYISNKEWEAKSREIEGARTNDKAKRSTGKNSAKYVSNDDYFDNVSSTNKKAMKKREIKKARAESREAAKEFNDKADQMVAAIKRKTKAGEARDKAKARYEESVERTKNSMPGPGVKMVNKALEIDNKRKYKNANDAYKIADKESTEYAYEARDAMRNAQKKYKRYKRKMLHSAMYAVRFCTK